MLYVVEERSGLLSIAQTLHLVSWVAHQIAVAINH
jgi:hypothetical protein